MNLPLHINELIASQFLSLTLPFLHEIPLQLHSTSLLLLSFCLSTFHRAQSKCLDDKYYLCVQFGFSINSIILLHDWRWDRTASFTTTITAHFSNHDPLTEFGDFSYWTKKKHKFSVIELSYKIKFSSFHINETTFTLNCLMVPSKATALPEK